MKNLPKIAELAARLYVFVFINAYGFGKIMGSQFYRKGQLPPDIAQTTAEKLTGFHLAWLFFGYSKTYILFVGIAQVIGGFLLLFERTKLIGVLILVPILLNIIVIDAVFSVPGGALVSSIIYLLMLVFVVFYNQQRVWEIWGILTRPQPQAPVSLTQSAVKWALALVVGLAFLALEIGFLRKLID